MKSETMYPMKEIERLEEELVARSLALADLKRQMPRETIADYALAGWEGPVKLSDLFQGKPDLIVIHNMGKGCRYCTLWADGFNGVWKHLADRAGFVVCSPDSPEVQREFAKSRGWQFPMVSGIGSTFIQDMGFRAEKSWEPGVSTFQRTADGGIVRVTKASFGPFDPFCAVWHLIALLGDGVQEWEPRYQYD